MSESFDVVIIGSGVGGGTLARVLSETNARILIIERGDFIPQEPENWSPQAVWRDLRYRTTERWLNGKDEEFHPYTHYCVGGNSKFWGSVLFRFRREDFGAMQHRDGVSPAWPIDYDTFAPYYERAEHMYSVHGEHGVDPTEEPRSAFPGAPVEHQHRMADIVDKLRGLGVKPFSLPLGLKKPGSPDGCSLCDTCNSFPCMTGTKSDSQTCGVDFAMRRPNVTIWTKTYAERLITNGAGDKIVAAECVRDGVPVRVTAPLFVVACGAVNSTALMLRSATVKHPNGLANSSGLVGRRYMAHLATMMGGLLPPRHVAGFQKTVAINDYYLKGPKGYPLGQIQSQGRVHPEQAKYGGSVWTRQVPYSFYKLWLAHGVNWLAMTEDLPNVDNRVTLRSDGRIRVQWQPQNAQPHRELVALTRKMLAKIGFWHVQPVSLGTSNTTHQCGTMVFGNDPTQSVLDTYCRSHDIDNLFVVDASFFPSSAAVNPGLTIAAQALRSADHIIESHLR